MLRSFDQWLTKYSRRWVIASSCSRLSRNRTSTGALGLSPPMNGPNVTDLPSFELSLICEYDFISPLVRTTVFSLWIGYAHNRRASSFHSHIWSPVCSTTLGRGSIVLRYTQSMLSDIFSLGCKGCRSVARYSTGCGSQEYLRGSFSILETCSSAPLLRSWTVTLARRSAFVCGM
ncbi:hypothetical protein IW137_003867 [Coemansia sp. RSA 1287]|nr:hypothetical protein IW137_003867 [Coemansia sp. RSA 1287]